jgi:hypothetical protein
MVLKGVEVGTKEVEVGVVTDYFQKIGVVAIEVHPRASLKLGDRIVIRGPHTHIEQTVDSLEINHQPVIEAGGRAQVGLLVHVTGPEEEWLPNIPRAGNKVYKLVG